MAYDKAYFHMVENNGRWAIVDQFIIEPTDDSPEGNRQLMYDKAVDSLVAEIGDGRTHVLMFATVVNAMS